MRFAMLYAPELLVVVSVDRPVATFLAETLALAITPPCASVMAPVRVAPATCARNGGEIARQSAKTDANSTNVIAFGFITPFLLFRTLASMSLQIRRQISRSRLGSQDTLGTSRQNS